MKRSHGAGDLRPSDSGSSVALAGWVARRRDHGGVAFVDLRDGTGVVQVVVRDEDAATELRPESCLSVDGAVRLRPEGNENSDLPTGEVEVVAQSIEVLSAAAPLPFPVEDSHAGQVGEEEKSMTDRSAGGFLARRISTGSSSARMLA